MHSEKKNLCLKRGPLTDKLAGVSASTYRHIGDSIKVAPICGYFKPTELRQAAIVGPDK